MTDFDLDLCPVVVSRFALDGGAMFGVIPRAMWERSLSPDSQHRVPLVARVLVVTDRRSGARLLIEAGLGQRWGAKERARYAIDGGDDLPTALAAVGIDPDTITHVLLTHLHWDHMRGLFRGHDRTQFELSFPRAEVLLSTAALARARTSSEKDRGSFDLEDIEALWVRARCRLIQQQDERPLPFVSLLRSDGHSDGLLVPFVAASKGAPAVVVPTDLIPTRAHLKASWVPAYDLRPDTSIREKQTIIARASELGALVFFYHDACAEAARVTLQGVDATVETVQVTDACAYNGT